MIATRKVRLVGSDEVVWALNDLTNSIKLSSSDKEQKYSDLLCALRVDVRTLNAEPPAGTVLTAEEFPVELMSGSSRS